jgi:hypothetical protein
MRRIARTYGRSVGCIMRISELLTEHCCEQARAKQHDPENRHGEETVGNEFVAHDGSDLVGWGASYRPTVSECLRDFEK